jgi:hypothetical protein
VLPLGVGEVEAGEERERVVERYPDRRLIIADDQAIRAHYFEKEA